jgi:hypothetical protein
MKNVTVSELKWLIGLHSVRRHFFFLFLLQPLLLLEFLTVLRPNEPELAHDHECGEAQFSILRNFLIQLIPL